MKKVFVVSFLVFLLGACSHRMIQPEQEILKLQLQTFVQQIPLQWEHKNIEFFEKNMLRSKRNQYILKELKKIETLEEQIRVYVTQPEYSFPKTEGIVGLQYRDRTEYVTIFYEWKKGRWFISTLEERR